MFKKTFWLPNPSPLIWHFIWVTVDVKTLQISLPILTLINDESITKFRPTNVISVVSFAINGETESTTGEITDENPKVQDESQSESKPLVDMVTLWEPSSGFVVKVIDSEVIFALLLLYKEDPILINVFLVKPSPKIVTLEPPVVEPFYLKNEILKLFFQ